MEPTTASQRLAQCTVQVLQGGKPTGAAFVVHYCGSNVLVSSSQVLGSAAAAGAATYRTHDGTTFTECVVPFFYKSSFCTYTATAVAATQDILDSHLLGWRSRQVASLWPLCPRCVPMLQLAATRSSGSGLSLAVSWRRLAGQTTAAAWKLSLVVTLGALLHRPRVPPRAASTACMATMPRCSLWRPHIASAFLWQPETQRSLLATRSHGTHQPPTSLVSPSHTSSLDPRTWLACLASTTLTLGTSS